MCGRVIGAVMTRMLYIALWHRNRNRVAWMPGSIWVGEIGSASTDCFGRKEPALRLELVAGA